MTHWGLQAEPRPRSSPGAPGPLPGLPGPLLGLPGPLPGLPAPFCPALSSRGGAVPPARISPPHSPRPRPDHHLCLVPAGSGCDSGITWTIIVDPEGASHARTDHSLDPQPTEATPRQTSAPRGSEPRPQRLPSVCPRHGLLAVGTAPAQDGSPHSGLRNFPCWPDAVPTLITALGPCPRVCAPARPSSSPAPELAPHALAGYLALRWARPRAGQPSLAVLPLIISALKAPHCWQK